MAYTKRGVLVFFVLVLMVVSVLPSGVVLGGSGRNSYAYYFTYPAYYGQRYVLEAFESGGVRYLRKSDGIYAYDQSGQLWHWQWSNPAAYLSMHLYDSSRLWVVWVSNLSLYAGIVKDGSLLSYKRLATFSDGLYDVQVLYFMGGTFLNPVFSHVVVLAIPPNLTGGANWNGQMFAARYDGSAVSLAWSKGVGDITSGGRTFHPFAIAKEGGLYLGDKPYFYTLALTSATWDAGAAAYRYVARLFRINFATGQVDDFLSGDLQLTFDRADYASDSCGYMNAFIGRMRITDVLPVGPWMDFGVAAGVRLDFEYCVSKWAIAGPYWETSWRGVFRTLRPIAMATKKVEPMAVFRQPTPGSDVGRDLVLFAASGDTTLAFAASPLEADAETYFTSGISAYIPLWYGTVRPVKFGSDYVEYAVFPGTQIYPYRLRVHTRLRPVSVSLNYPQDVQGCYHIYIDPGAGITGTMTVNAMQYAVVGIQSDRGTATATILNYSGTADIKLDPEKTGGNVSVNAWLTGEPEHFIFRRGCCGYGVFPLYLPGGGDIGCIHYTNVPASIRYLISIEPPPKPTSGVFADISVVHRLPTTGTIDIVVMSASGEEVSRVEGIGLTAGTGTLTESVRVGTAEGGYRVFGILHLPGYPVPAITESATVYRVVMFRPKITAFVSEVDTATVELGVYAHDGRTTFYDLTDSGTIPLASFELSGNPEHTYNVVIPLPEVGRYTISAQTEQFGAVSQMSKPVEITRLPPAPRMIVEQQGASLTIHIQTDMAGTLTVGINDQTIFSGTKDAGEHAFSYTLPEPGTYRIDAWLSVNGMESKKVQEVVSYQQIQVPPPVMSAPEVVQGDTATLTVQMPVSGTLYLAVGGHELGVSYLESGTHQVQIGLPGIGRHRISGYIEVGGVRSPMAEVEIVRLPRDPAIDLPARTYHRDVPITINSPDGGELVLMVDGELAVRQRLGYGISTITLRLDRGTHTVKLRVCEQDFCSHWVGADITIFDLIELWIGRSQYRVNGVYGAMDTAPFIDPTVNRTMVPLRFILEGLGFDVVWHGDTRQIEIKGKVYGDDGTAEDRIVIMTMPKTKPEMHGDYKVYPGSPLVKIIYADGTAVSIDMRNYQGKNMGIPFIYQNRTFVPVRFIAEVFGASVGWDASQRKVTIER